jgi:ribonuclease HI
MSPTDSRTGGGADLVAYIDGGARGNPGPAGFGVRVEQRDGTLVEEFSESIGVATNNVAEYRGLLAALEWARAHGHHALHVRSDSLLLVQQMRGVYKVKSVGLQPLHAKALLSAHQIGTVTYEHVRRESNTHADRLANAAMDGLAEAAGANQAANQAPASAVDAAAEASVPFNVMAGELRVVVGGALAGMRAITDSEARRPIAPGKWCRKEIVGHLIDSATNNHQRFLRAQERSPLVFPAYDPDFWIRVQAYTECDWNELVTLWEGFNRHLAHVLENVPETKHAALCRIGANEPVSLGALAADYIAHLRHHLSGI